MVEIRAQSVLDMLSKCLGYCHCHCLFVYSLISWIGLFLCILNMSRSPIELSLDSIWTAKKSEEGSGFMFMSKGRHKGDVRAILI